MWLGLAVSIYTLAIVSGYDAKFDNFEVDKVLASDTMFTAYIDCILGKGSCALEHSAEFKEIIPEIIATACEKCSSIQKKNTRKMVKAIMERKPEEAIEFRKKFDPDGKYEKNFVAFLAEES